MGMQSTKKDFIYHILSMVAKDGRIISYKLVEKSLWILLDYDSYKAIEHYSISLDNEGWQFKGSDEYQGIREVSCPLLWLGIAKEFDPEWRAKVKAYHR